MSVYIKKLRKQCARKCRRSPTPPITVEPYAIRIEAASQIYGHTGEKQNLYIVELIMIASKKAPTGPLRSTHDDGT